MYSVHVLNLPTGVNGVNGVSADAEAPIVFESTLVRGTRVRARPQSFVWPFPPSAMCAQPKRDFKRRIHQRFPSVLPLLFFYFLPTPPPRLSAGTDTHGEHAMQTLFQRVTLLFVIDSVGSLEKQRKTVYRFKIVGNVFQRPGRKTRSRRNSACGALSPVRISGIECKQYEWKLTVSCNVR